MTIKVSYVGRTGGYFHSCGLILTGCLLPKVSTGKLHEAFPPLVFQLTYRLIFNKCILCRIKQFDVNLWNFSVAVILIQNNCM